MPISRITRNSLVYANNKTQNIESRLFGLPTQSGSLYLQNSQSLYLQDLSGTYVLEYPSAIALSYNSYYNKFIADRSTQNSLLRTRYYTSESKATGNFGYILYENSRSMYTQATPDIYLLEYSSTSSLLSDTGSNALLLRTRYFASESKASSDLGYILYENSRSIYLQNISNLFILENATTFGTSASIQETGSNVLSFRTRYYISESKASSIYLGYQNDRAVYLENTANPFVIEYSGTSSLLTDTGSNALSFRTRYYTSESKASSIFLGYQNDRSIYLENTANPFVIEYSATSSLLTDTGSNALSFKTKYYISESKASSIFLGYQNDRAVYLENTANPFVIEYSSTSSLLTDSGSNNQALLTKYYLSESKASVTYLGYQNDRAIYLENTANIFIIETPDLILDLDAANYSAMPTSGSIIAGTGGYAINMVNGGSSMSWNSANGGVFRKSSAGTSDLLIVGPNYSAGTQAYTVFMAYKWDGGTAGRLLNTNAATPDWLLGLWGAPAARMNIAYTDASNFIGGSATAADTNWHFIWLTWNGSNSLNSYIATSSQPTSAQGTSASGGGFNKLRAFGRYSTATTSSEPVTGDIGFIKVWGGVLTLSEIQDQYATYKTRFGY